MNTTETEHISPHMIRVVQDFRNTTIKRLWKAITDVNEMKQLFFENIPDFQPKEGFETEFTVKSSELEFVHFWRISELIENKKMTYEWRYKGYPGQSYVTFNLIETKSGCTLELTHTGITTFPQKIEEFKPESCHNGWKFFIKGRLLNHLNS